MVARAATRSHRETETSATGRLRHVRRGADAEVAGEDWIGSGDLEDLVLEILEVERKLIQLSAPIVHRVVGDEAVDLVVVCVAAARSVVAGFAT